MEKHSSSFVQDVEKMLAQDSAVSRRDEAKRWTAQHMYLVPEWLKGGNTQAYQPQLVSLGPFHHSDSKLLPMEDHKRRALLRVVRRSNKRLEHFIAAINGDVGKLMAEYGKDLDAKWRNDKQRFLEMMLRDGCFLLEMIWDTTRDYEQSDPVFSKLGKGKIKHIVRSDMLLLENQLPLLVLKKIRGVLHPDYPEDKMNNDINIMVLSFLGRGHQAHDIAAMSPHPLELCHRSLTKSQEAHGGYSQDYNEMIPSALEIHEAGIEFRKSKEDNLLDIRFERGVLSMPVLKVNEYTESLYLNLMAFERLNAEVSDLVTAYVIFMDNMIVTAKDVAMLSSNGVLENTLGCNEETAKLFNGTLSKRQFIGHCHGLHKVQHDVKNYCRTPWHKWRAALISTYFRNPWAIISLAAAVVLLTSTVVQTVYTVKSYKP